jgi:hypothetical protein
VAYRAGSIEPLVQIVAQSRKCLALRDGGVRGNDTDDFARVVREIVERPAAEFVEREVPSVTNTRRSTMSSSLQSL